MIGNAVDYDKRYKSNFPVFPAKFDWDLKRYLSLIPGKEVLDLGIGQGRNSIPLVELGFNVTGVDYSYKCLEICKNTCSQLNLIQSDIRTFNIEENKYDLISSRCVLHFFHKSDTSEVIKNIKNGLKIGGLVYIYVFSIEDPKLIKRSISPDFEVLENNILHNKINDTYVSFFTKEEVLELFDDFETISISSEYSLDLERDVPDYFGIIKYVGRKVNNI